MSSNRGFLTWIMPGGYQSKLDTVDRHGDKFTQVCLFFLDLQADGSIFGNVGNTEAAVAYAKNIADRWPHIRWLFTVANDGEQARINPLVRNKNGERSTFFTDMHTILDKYSWIDGMDFDFERVEENEQADIYSLYSECYDEVKSRSSNTWVSLDLPPMTGPYETVGAEQWVDYARFNGKFDGIQIMTYDFAWVGSAPGPTTPISWAKDVMDYATSVVDKNKISLGVAAYGYRWQIYDYPKNRVPAGASPPFYRGSAGSFQPFLRWMLGGSTHTDANHDGGETQQYIPFFSFYDEENYVHELLLYIYDYPGAGEEDSKKLPLVRGSYQGKPFLSCYSKRQKESFQGTIVNKSGTDFDVSAGALDAIKKQGMVRPIEPAKKGSGSGSGSDSGGNKQPTEEGYAKYTFNVSAAGTYDIVLQVKYDWWDEDLLYFKLDGTGYSVGDKQQWYPYYQTTHWVKMTTTSLSSGSHTLELVGANSRYLTQFYGFKVCSNFSAEYYGGEAELTTRPRNFLDVDKKPAWPHNNKFVITAETLRRNPETVAIWNDDFSSWSGSDLPARRYRINSGSWKIKNNQNGGGGSGATEDAYYYLEGSGEFVLDYSNFSDVEVKATIRLDGNGKAGVIFGDVWFCINTGTGNLELYNGSTRLFAYASSYEAGTLYTLSMRVRGNQVRCYSGGSYVFEKTASGAGSGAFGIKSDANMRTDLLRAGDSYWYHPREAIEITLPDGTTETLGRIPRNVSWDSEGFGFFKVTADDEESTRQEPESGLPKEIVQDWDYLHSSVFTMNGPGDYPISMRAIDFGMWTSTFYTGDADGFSIAYYGDGNTIAQMSDIAALEYGIAGVGMWSLGQEDPLIWKQLVSHV